MAQLQKFIHIRDASIPALGLGTWELTGETCRDVVSRAIDMGYRHIDTAQAYDNESMVGAGIEQSGVGRDELWLTTKVWKSNYRHDALISSVEESLRKLRTDYVDLLLLHWPNDKVPVGEPLEAMLALQERGCVRHLGVSNFTPRLVREALSVAPILCNQVEYHPGLHQQTLLDLARERRMLLTAYSPLGRGTASEHDALTRIGERHQKTAEQVALRWLVQQDNVAAIPKASSEKHLRSNFEIFDFTLSEDEMETIFALGSDERLIDPDYAPRWGQA